jgi:predicted tellurium resistance membrane protein TerC
VLYFIVATVWLPDFVLSLDAVASASETVRDFVVLVVWGGALVAGMYLLRWAQRRDLI